MLSLIDVISFICKGWKCPKSDRWDWIRGRRADLVCNVVESEDGGADSFVCDDCVEVSSRVSLTWTAVTLCIDWTKIILVNCFSQIKLASWNESNSETLEKQFKELNHQIYNTIIVEFTNGCTSRENTVEHVTAESNTNYKINSKPKKLKGLQLAPMLT